MGYNIDVDGYPVPEQYGPPPLRGDLLPEVNRMVEDYVENAVGVKPSFYSDGSLREVSIERLPDMPLDIEGIGPVTAHLMRVHFEGDTAKAPTDG